FKVQNTLGAGSLEKAYENALTVELKILGLSIESQKTFPVRYEGTVVGNYQADLVVSARVMVECKAVSNLDVVHDAQLMNYLKASGLRLGLLINFARPKLQYRRLVV
ncbi:MAG TPA: GxxExxY protein, partial [Candidatus Acidoferrales bacterium]|nr:GxxExxY protein [Candidatus Acidoferrales bacterium]